VLAAAVLQLLCCRTTPAGCPGRHPHQLACGCLSCSDGPGVATLHNEGKLVPLLQKAGAMRGLGSA